MNRSPRVVAMDYLARREHSRAELLRKLKQKEIPIDEIEQALDRLVEQGLQSDQHFAKSFAEQRQRNGYGPVRIENELRQRGVAEMLIHQTMLALPEDWIVCVQRVWQRKFGEPPEDLKAKARQQRFLLQRGFSYEQIRCCDNTPSLRETK